jgi:metal-sulfur cluster biosynthetic enzyme
MTTELAKTSLTDVDFIREALREVIDPEIGMNIVDLGLVYRIEVTDEYVRVEMTMTSPACPMGEMIVDDVNAVLNEILPNTVQSDVHLVWDPPWEQSMMSDAGNAYFGW